MQLCNKKKNSSIIVPLIKLNLHELLDVIRIFNLLPFPSPVLVLFDWGGTVELANYIQDL